MLAVWFSTPESEDIIEARSDITLQDIKSAYARVVDIFNGTDQELNITVNGGDTVLEGMLIKDYPTFVRLTYSQG